MATSVRYLAPASDGGRGSHSFDDTAVFGNRGFHMVELGGGGQLLLPGQGGGAAPRPEFSFGSMGGGGSPNGAVVIRLFTVT